MALVTRGTVADDFLTVAAGSSASRQADIPAAQPGLVEAVDSDREESKAPMVAPSRLTYTPGSPSLAPTVYSMSDSSSDAETPHSMRQDIEATARGTYDGVLHETGGGNGGESGMLIPRPLPGDVRWGFMCLLDSLFFSVKEPLESLDSHPAVHALLESFLEVRAVLERV